MDKLKINYIVDVGLMITFLIAFVTGILKWPSLRRNLGFITDWRLIGRMHDFSGLFMGILVLVHIILHLDWIKAMTKKYFF